MNFNEIFEENITNDDIKSDWKTALHSLQTLHFLKYILKVNAWIFFNKTSILVFA